MRVLGLTGYKQSGKSTLAGVGIMQFGFHRMGFSDALKDIIRDLWPAFTQEHRLGSLKEEVLEEYGKSFREVAQVVGTDLFRTYDPDVWVRALRKRIHSYYYSMGPTAARNLVIDDVRFDNEAALIRELGGQVWEVVRADSMSQGKRLKVQRDTHISEQGLLASSVDMVILNTFGLDEYRAMCSRKVKEFVDGE